ncbi:Uncharacterised protein [Helicobacter mustelae]|nr:Uncharacterised protein [Helicobacter mustelae]STP12661.1 Uncharacterised protein [Helicobacter mustelae]
MLMVVLAVVLDHRAAARRGMAVSFDTNKLLQDFLISYLLVFIVGEGGFCGFWCVAEIWG